MYFMSRPVLHGTICPSVLAHGACTLRIMNSEYTYVRVASTKDLHISQLLKNGVHKSATFKE